MEFMEHRMDKDEDKEKMTIYANVHSLNIHDVRTETENTRKHQTPQHTGSDCVKSRRYRSAVVCLVLLCVLLLTAVIVLCVIFTQERQQFISKNQNLTNEREQLILKNTNLTNEREQLSELLNCVGWTFYQSSFYYKSNEKKNWTESRRYCTERGADLISINNRQEQDFVKKISANAKVWIGLTDSDVEGIWKWVDGSTPTSRFWGPGEPNGQITEDCALNDLSVWADYPCSYAFKWICEKSLVK